MTLDHDKVAQLREFDVADHLQTADDVIGYLEAVFDDGDPRYIPIALRNVAEAHGMAELARAAGVSRAGLYKALREGGNPTLSTLVSVLRELGLRLTVTPIDPADAA